MQLISNLIKDLNFHYVIDIYSKYAWVIPSKDKKVTRITNSSQKF